MSSLLKVLKFLIELVPALISALSVFEKKEEETK